MADVKSTTTKKTTKEITHPKYSEMISTAIATLKERGGSSRVAIIKFITSKYKVSYKPNIVNSNVKLALKKGVESGSLTQVKGTGASGSFKLAKKAAEKTKKVVKSPKATKSPKKSKAKKVAPKKPKTFKSPKTVANSAKMAVKSSTKSKKSTKSKMAAKSPKKSTKSPKKVTKPKPKKTTEKTAKKVTKSKTMKPAVKKPAKK